MKKFIKILGICLIIWSCLTGYKLVIAGEISSNYSEVNSENVVEINLIECEDTTSTLIVESTDSSNKVYEALVTAPVSIGVSLKESFTSVPPQSKLVTTTSYGYYYSGTMYRQYVSFVSGKYYSQYTGISYRQGPI